MHEIGVVRAMVKTVTDYAAANQISEISEIVADCGELSLVIPEYVEELYPPVVKGTPLENTKLIVNIVPGMAECEDCDEIFNVVRLHPAEQGRAAHGALDNAVFHFDIADLPGGEQCVVLFVH